MFGTLLTPGAYRIDYFHRQGLAVENRLGFYVRGGLEETSSYSLQARLHLLAGFQLIQVHLGMENLVAVYVDIASCDEHERPAYNQLKRDLLQGLFTRLFVYKPEDLAECANCQDDLAALQRQINNLEILVFDPRRHEVVVQS